MAPTIKLTFTKERKLAQLIINANTIYNLIDGNYEFSNNLNGSGDITFAGNHMVAISGNNNLTGDLIANNKELKINGSTAGDVIINNNATLSGNGFMQDLTLNAGAAVAPGNSIGTLNVNSITYNNSSISNFEFNRTAIDKINATDNAIIAGTLNLTSYQDSGEFVVAQNIIETTNGAVSGQFSQVNIDDNYIINLQYNQKM